MATTQFLSINSNFFVDFKILGGMLWQVTSLQGGMLVKMAQPNLNPEKIGKLFSLKREAETFFVWPGGEGDFVPKLFLQH